MSWLSRVPNTHKVRSSSLRSDKTFILLDSAGNVPQPRQEKTNWVVPLLNLKQNKAIESV